MSVSVNLPPEEGWLEGADVVVVGGGPSLRRLDWRHLHRPRRFAVIGVNRSYERLVADGAEPDFGVTLDEQVIRLWQQQGMLLRDLARVIFPQQNGAVPEVVTLPRVRAGWPDTWDDGVYGGGNSGVAALSVADLLSPRRIYLLGFDCGTVCKHGWWLQDCGQCDVRDGVQEWWHEGYPWPRSEAAIYDRTLAQFCAVRDLVRAPVRVLGESRLLEHGWKRGKPPWE